MHMIFSATRSEDVLVRVAAFECLVQVASSYYDFLPAYMPEIFPLTGSAIQKEEEDVSLQAVEFWATIADEERLRVEENEEVCLVLSLCWPVNSYCRIRLNVVGERKSGEGALPHSLVYCQSPSSSHPLTLAITYKTERRH